MRAQVWIDIGERLVRLQLQADSLPLLEGDLCGIDPALAVEVLSGPNDREIVSDELHRALFDVERLGLPCGDVSEDDHPMLLQPIRSDARILLDVEGRELPVHIP
ncbi:hypothetical protein emb_1d0652 [Coriobacteriaceae bacterium EMTCatB1]|nr:hypothetical protein emb_1d0652 [Coriobacteriaceae bacterium EMTCatB1]